MKITIEYDKGETLSPIGFAKAVTEFWDVEDVNGVVDAFKEMAEYLQVYVKYMRDEKTRIYGD